jgi:MSHA pilin protein MshC
MRRGHQTGFTLPELILVMIIMGVLAAVAAPRLVSWQTIDQLGFRDDLRAMLRHAHKVAISQNRDVCVVLSGAAGTATAVYGAGNVCNSGPVADPGTGQPYTINVPTGLVLANNTVYFSKRTGLLSPYADKPLAIGSLPNPALTVSRETGFVACSTGAAAC